MLAYKRIITLSCLLLATLAALLSLITIIGYSEELPRGSLVLASSPSGISFEGCDNNDQIDSSAIVSTREYAASELSTSPYPIKVEINYTNESYVRLVPFNFLHGGYFVQSSAREANAYVVISDSLSLTLFKTYASVGKSLIINNREYLVCGVYKQADNLIKELSSNGLEQIYTSYSNLEGYENAEIKRLYLNDTLGSGSQQLISKAGLQQYSHSYYTMEFNDIRHVIAQSLRLSLFFPGVALICLLLYLAVKKAMGMSIAEGKSIFCERSILFKGIGVVGGLILAILLFFLIRFDIFIPARILPPDNIFDVSFYFEAIAGILQGYNVGGVYSFHCVYAFLLIAASAIVGAVLSVMMVVTLWRLARVVKLKMKYISEG